MVEEFFSSTDSLPIITRFRKKIVPLFRSQKYFVILLFLLLFILGQIRIVEINNIVGNIHYENVESDVSKTHAVVYVGPHKTGTTTIQALSDTLSQELKSDNYEMPWMDTLTRTQNEVNFAACFQPVTHEEENTTQGCFHEYLVSGLKIGHQKKNIFISAKSFYRKHMDLEALAAYLSVWDKIIIIIYYRRYYDRFQSAYSEYAKDCLKLLKQPVPIMEYYTNPEHNLESTIDLVSRFKQHFNNVEVINYHEKNVDLGESFYCNAMPGATNTCKTIKNTTENRHTNSSQTQVYEKLTLHASDLGLIPTRIQSKQDLESYSTFIRKHQEETLGLTTNDFKMNCLTQKSLSSLLDQTLEEENSLFPEFFKNSKYGKVALKPDFDTQTTTKLCDVDRTAVLETEEWKSFFKSFSKPLIKLPPHPTSQRTLWSDDRPLCQNNYSPICVSTIVLEKHHVTFCSAAKVASTAIKSYFFQISDGTVEVKSDSKYPMHQASWTYLKDLPTNELKTLVIGNYNTSAEWTQVVFLKNVVRRFVSGYLDKVLRECSLPESDDYVFHAYEEFGFSCEKYSNNFEEFITFMESVPKMEGHFAPQTFVCEYEKYPYTHLIYADDEMNNRLGDLSHLLNVTYNPPKKASAHKTGSEKKMVELFKGRKDLLQRVLDIFEEDCKLLPKLCDVSDLLMDTQN